MATEYDDYPYDNFPFAATHPDHLATIATLFGLRPEPPDRCRILELGCGRGGNLLPMAAGLPNSEIVGVDHSQKQIAAGQADIAALGLRNIDLLPIDILDVDTAIGTFDYILCHGVYAWVAPEVQARILEICRAHLTPHGVAYISFNTLPGWHLRGMLRDLLRREAGTAGSQQERVARARAFLRFLEAAPAGYGPAQAWLKSEIDLLAQLSDAYLYYDHLAEPSYPLYFADFARDADRAGLAYLGDAHFQSMLPDRLGEVAERAVAARSRNIIETEQAMDILEQRSFRRALLCKKEVRVDREVTARRLADLWVAARALPVSATPDIAGDTEEVFSRPGSGDLRTSLPILKAALVLLGREYPRGLPFEELWQKASTRVASEPLDRDRLGGNLFGLYVRDQIDLRVRERPYVMTAGPRPSTTALIRHQAAHDRHGCTNLRHEKIAVDPFARALIARLDGSRSREEIAADLGDENITVEHVEEGLDWLGRAALLEA